MQFLIKTIKVNQSFLFPLWTQSMYLASSLSYMAAPRILHFTSKTISSHFYAVSDDTAVKLRELCMSSEATLFLKRVSLHLDFFNIDTALRSGEICHNVLWIEETNAATAKQKNQSKQSFPENNKLLMLYCG